MDRIELREALKMFTISELEKELNFARKQRNRQDIRLIKAELRKRRK